MCKQIDHFPEETDYEADPSEYFLREYIVSSREIICVFWLLKRLKYDHKEIPHHAFLYLFLKVLPLFALSPTGARCQ